ncbi:etoposide-induced protein 2.4, partial [Lingula anatina]|uniref:Etoposide-induced protein 2.4 n=1 Tax=Lingula anatina TaxID=7574 RepID=A0A2R2MLK9_LINAN
LSIYMFNRAVLPCLQFLIHYFTGGTAATIWHWMGPLLTWTFSALWIIPIFILSKIVNALWFQDIADAAYRKSRGRPLLPSLQMLIADLLFSIILESVFLIQGMLAKRLLPIPGIGDLVSILHMCLLYSLYSFEYKWFNMNWPLQKRVAYIENNWPYFVGFGLPLAIMTSMADSFVISGCVFSLFFPLFIISANEAGHIHEIHDMPLMLFTPAAKVTNQLFPKLSRRATPSSGHTTPSSGHSTPAGTPKKQLHIR